MTMPAFGYVSPEQLMADRAEYARKGIARGRSLIATSCQDGILICAENASSTLRKISEIYDRIAFAGAGKYNEFEQLRMGGVRHADYKGYYYSRHDVDAQSLANLYAQLLGMSFTHEAKPMEVEVIVTEVSEDQRDDRIFHILYDGTINDRQDFTVIGGETEPIDARMGKTWRANASMPQALGIAVGALTGNAAAVDPETLEVGMLLRSEIGGRTFRRLETEEISKAIQGKNEKTNLRT